MKPTTPAELDALAGHGATFTPRPEVEWVNANLTDLLDVWQGHPVMFLLMHEADYGVLRDKLERWSGRIQFELHRDFLVVGIRGYLGKDRIIATSPRVEQGFAHFLAVNGSCRTTVKLTGVA